MWEFLSNNWLWILLIGGMLFMHLGHGAGHGAGHGGCGGGHQHSAHQHSDTPRETEEDPAATSRPVHDHDHGA